MTRYLILAILAATSSCLSSNSKTATGASTDLSSVILEDKSRSSAYTDSIEYILAQTSLIGSFRVWEDKDSTISFSQDWLDLYREGEEFHLDTLHYTLSKDYDECAGVDLVIITSHRSSMLYLQVPQVKKGKPVQISVPKQVLWPEEKAEFTFNKQHYMLQALGKIHRTEKYIDDNDTEQVFHEVSDYRLLLTTPDKHTYTILSEQSFNDTFIRLLFVGDLDQDGKPDFVVSAPRDYEEERTLLILSSQMSKDKVVIYEATRQFDC
ncbi:integrin alpha [Sphingobacterium wenxiniae]|uniref:VCBS repeat-containing protein n=1 Tax=Sphingobacterium wenxiniae TaxID=683125 RepID=A0A1I6QPK5_9SPHI|nr:integrin alpha [Sphingobacterium wenxiniae]SFS54355.1 hypothetical protein SAMN05660206_102459 [Sphingobacterium wenxiniae]